MIDYIANKKKLDTIKNNFGELAFRMGVSHLIDVGIRHLTEESVEETCKEIMQEDDTNHFMTNRFKCDIVRVAYELAQIPHIDLLVYIQREIAYNVFDDMPSYDRAIQLLKGCMSWIESDYCEQTLNDFEWLGFDDDEIKALGWGYILDVEEEE